MLTYKDITEDLRAHICKEYTDEASTTVLSSKYDIHQDLIYQILYEGNIDIPAGATYTF